MRHRTSQGTGKRLPSGRRRLQPLRACCTAGSAVALTPLSPAWKKFAAAATKRPRLTDALSCSH
eukprot:10066256-Lingulodinium_polyedra.AAC.1